MSEYETHKGKLSELFIPENFLTFGQKTKYLLSKGFEFDYVDTQNEVLDSENVFYLNLKFYELTKHESLTEEEECIITKKENGDYEFLLSFYNGGGSFQESLEDSITDFEEK